nr:MAG TPA: hypothetical protein [Caudoviricetes sp.]
MTVGYGRAPHGARGLKRWKTGRDHQHTSCRCEDHEDRSQ